MESYGKPWEATGIHRKHGNPWQTTGNHGKPWEAKGNRWGPWEAMENLGETMQQILCEDAQSNVGEMTEAVPLATLATPQLK